MKKIISIFIIVSILFSSVFSQTQAADDCSALSGKILYPLFRERVKCICDQYKPQRELKYIEDEYEEIETVYILLGIKNRYKTNMNDIYKCALLSSQKKAIRLIKEDLIKVNPDLLDRLTPPLDEKLMLIDLTMSKLECKNTQSKNSVIKQDVLSQTTYEACKYVNYLEYLKEQNQHLDSIILDQEGDYSIKGLILGTDFKLDILDEEIEHTFKVFPIAFHAYTEYENNIVIHFLLELIKEDYLILRDKFHLVLNPLNQVVYKISNAMRLE